MTSIRFLAGLGIALAGVASCQIVDETGEVAMDCPTIVRAAAWVDRMPRIGEPAGTLHILLRSDTEGAWSISASEASTLPHSRFTINLSDGDVSSQIRYSARQSGPPPERIAIECGGTEIASIADVEEVY